MDTLFTQWLSDFPFGAVPSSASTAHLDQAPTPVPNSPLPLRRDAFFTPAGFLYPVVVKGISNGP